MVEFIIGVGVGTVASFGGLTLAGYHYVKHPEALVGLMMTIKTQAK